MKALFIAVSIALLLASQVSARAEEEVAPDSAPTVAPAPSVAACEFSELIASGMLASYDKNGDGMLSKEESLSGYERFKATLPGSPHNPSWLLKDIFTFVMMYGRLPKPGVAGVAELENWIIQVSFTHYELTQERLTQAVSALLCPAQP